VVRGQGLVVQGQGLKVRGQGLVVQGLKVRGHGQGLVVRGQGLVVQGQGLVVQGLKVQGQGQGLRGPRTRTCGPRTLGPRTRTRTSWSKDKDIGPRGQGLSRGQQHWVSPTSSAQPHIFLSTCGAHRSLMLQVIHVFAKN